MLSGKLAIRLMTLALSLLITVAGCSQFKAAIAVANTIPIKAWIVLGPSAGEQIGGDNNRGCRLTQAEIDLFRSQLIQNRKIYSAALIITWMLPDQQVINDPGIPVFGPRMRDIDAFQQQVVETGNWAEGFLNIFFAAI